MARGDASSFVVIKIGLSGDLPTKLIPNYQKMSGESFPGKMSSLSGIHKRPGLVMLREQKASSE